MEKYRVFISYSHQDENLVKKIVKVISGNGLIPVWDESLLFGRAFKDQIYGYIAHAHVFLPVITEASCKRGWVQQEIGYALALNVPVLPVTFESLPGEMLHELHAVHLSDDTQEMKRRLPRNIFDSLVDDHKKSELALFQCAELQEQRTRMMIEYANFALGLEPVLGSEAFGMVRQKGGLSSFHIPDKVLSDAIWKERYGCLRTSQYHCQLQRDERLVLEKHASQKGCRLIINPYLSFDQYGLSARIVRLKNIAEFLETKTSYNVQVAINQLLQDETLTIVGDWFLAQSASRGQGVGYQQTIFTRHAPSIQKRIKLFDEDFEDLLKKQEWTPETSREEALKLINQIIDDLEKKKC